MEASIEQLRRALAALADGNPDMMDGAEIDRLHGMLDAALDELERLRVLVHGRESHAWRAWRKLRRQVAEQEGGAG